MRLIEALKIISTGKQPGASDRVFQIVLASGFTPLHLLTFLKAHLSLALPDRKIEARVGLYGDIFGALKAVEPGVDAALVAVEWSDLDPRLSIRHLGGWEPERLPEIAAGVRDRLAQLAVLVSEAAGRAPVAVSLPTLPLPPAAHHPLHRQSPFEAELIRAVAQFAADLSAVPGVAVVSPAELDRLSPPSARHDVKAELESGFPYQLAHAEAVASLLARIAAPAAPKKALITDLDDTLWRGILGDDGVEGVAWDLDHRAQIHGYYQQIVRALAATGVLVGVVSKNDPALVEKALARPDLLARASDLFPIEAGWGPKSEAIARILRIWNIGADSVVFVDDSAMEVDEVRRAHPGIEAILFPAHDPAAAYELCRRLRDRFGKTDVGEEDRIRSQSLRASRPPDDGGVADVEGFLRSADASLSLVWAEHPVEPRVLELINKTNQFNINGRRRAGAEWSAYTARPDTSVLVASYRDKYGPLGKIAALAGRRDGNRFHIETWVMSCRAFSRRIEHHILKEVFDRHDVAEVTVDFEPTERNQPSAAFLRSVAASADDPTRILRSSFLARCPVLYHTRTEAAAVADAAR